MKDAKTSAQRRLFTQLVSEAHSRINVVVIADIGLILPAESEREVEFLAYFKIVLHKSGKFKLIVVQDGISGSTCELKRRLQSGLTSPTERYRVKHAKVVVQARKRPRSDEVVLRE